MKVVATKKAPDAVGPYSQAYIHNGILYTAGQVPINPETNNIDATTIEEQAEQSCKNLAAVLEEAGSSLDKVVKTVVFIKNMDDFALVNEVYGEYFVNNKPARSCVEVARLPKDALIEIEAIATK